MALLRPGDGRVVELRLRLFELLDALLHLAGPVVRAVHVQPGAGAPHLALGILQCHPRLFDVLDQIRTERLKRVDGGNFDLI